MNYLEKIVADKREELIEQRQRTPLSELTAMLADAPPTRPFAQSIRSRNGIIAEFKRQSPSRGVIHANICPRDVVSLYEAAGVSAISCLTNTKHFGGTTSDLLEAVCSTSSVPILRKEFIVDEYQVVEARAFGASAILLIAAILTVDEARHLALAAKQLGMEVLMELHDETETGYIVDGVTVAGINNRNLRTFEVDINHSIQVSHLLPHGLPRISESGIRTIDDMLRLRREGFDGFLIGENFMREANPGQACLDFCKKYQDAWQKM